MAEHDFNCYPSPEENKRLIEAMLANPKLKTKLGGTAIGGSDDYFSETVNKDQMKLFEEEKE